MYVSALVSFLKQQRDLGILDRRLQKAEILEIFRLSCTWSKAERTFKYSLLHVLHMKNLMFRDQSAQSGMTAADLEL